MPRFKERKSAKEKAAQLALVLVLLGVLGYIAADEEITLDSIMNAFTSLSEKMKSLNEPEEESTPTHIRIPHFR